MENLENVNGEAAHWKISRMLEHLKNVVVGNDKSFQES